MEAKAVAIQNHLTVLHYLPWRGLSSAERAVTLSMERAMTSRRNPAAHGESRDEPLATGSGLRGIPLARKCVMRSRTCLTHLPRTSPLVYLVADDAQSEGISPGRSLQRRILQAIEALRPSVNTPGRAGAAASLRHRLLYLRYVEMKDISEICAELAISQRKYYVEHVLGIKALISLLTTATPVAFRTIRQFSPSWQIRHSYLEARSFRTHSLAG